MTDICKVCLKTVKRYVKAIPCDRCDNWIHIKCNKLDKLDYKMLQKFSGPMNLYLLHLSVLVTFLQKI